MAPTTRKLREEEKKRRRREKKTLTMRILREKEKKDPIALEERRRKDRERYHKKKESNKIKTISDYTEREKRIIRKIWRIKARRQREKRKALNRAQSDVTHSSNLTQPCSSRVLSGRKVSSRNKRRILIENSFLKTRVMKLETKVSKYKMRLRRLRLKTRGSSMSPMQANTPDKQPEHEELQKAVIAFLEDDESSRLTAGKKETITSHKQKKQIRLLNDTLQNLHKTFMEKTGRRISYSIFCKYRPFWVLIPSEKTRNTCLCVTHTNISNLVNTLKTSRMIDTNSPKKLAQTICCGDKLMEKCLEKRCLDCKEKKLTYNHFNEEDKVLYQRWVSKRVKTLVRGKEKICQKTVKETILLTKREAANMMNDKILQFMKHQANITHQYKAITRVKNNLRPNEALLHIDFSENYSCKYGEEIQSAHFGGSKPQICLHTSVLYYQDEQGLKPESICTLSENLRHDPVLVCAHLKPIFDRLNAIMPNLNSLHILSDGATTQYRNKKMFHLIMKFICPELHIDNFVWHYSEAGHGKGAPDGVGGCIKRTADRGAALGKDVNDFTALISYLKENCRGVNMMPIDDSSVAEIEAHLNDTLNPPFKGTLKIHQLSWSIKNPSMLRVRRLSCVLCKTDEHCSHYEIGIIGQQTDATVCSSPESAEVKSIAAKRSKVYLTFSSDTESEDDVMTPRTKLSAPVHSSPELAGVISDFAKRRKIYTIYSSDSDPEDSLMSSRFQIEPEKNTGYDWESDENIFD